MSDVNEMGVPSGARPEALVSLTTAATLSGSSERHLRRLIREKHLMNHGSVRAPRIRLSNLLRKTEEKVSDVNQTGVPSGPCPEMLVSLTTAAKLSGHSVRELRCMIRAGRIKNYGTVAVRVRYRDLPIK